MTYDSFRDKVHTIDSTVSNRQLNTLILKLFLMLAFLTFSFSTITYTCTRGGLGSVMIVVILILALFFSICKLATSDISGFNSVYNTISRFWALISLLAIIATVLVKVIV